MRMERTMMPARTYGVTQMMNATRRHPTHQMTWTVKYTHQATNLSITHASWLTASTSG